MTPRKTSFVPGKVSKMSRKFVTIAANMATSHMIIRSLQSSTRNKKMMTINTRHQRKVMRRRTTRRKGLSQENRRSRLSLENGSRMVNPQMMTQVMKNPRKRLWGLPCMMMKMMVMRHLYLHHPCASWQELTPR